jgi:putative ABC transport system permease protein
MRRVLLGLLSRLRGILFRRASDLEMDEELSFHVEMETEKYMREGLDAPEARRRALAAFGGMERHRQRLREGRQVPLLEPLWHDVQFGFRSLAHHPGLSLIAAVTIALGVGATTTVFSAVEAILLRPLPIPGVEGLVTLQERRGGLVASGIEGMLIPYDRYEVYRDATAEIFSSLAAHRLVDAYSLRLADATIAVNGAATSGNYFQTLGVPLAMGRPYASDDAHEIVISHDLWVSRFGADPGVIGRTVGLNGHSMVVVGVAPAGFGGTTFVAGKVWAPASIRGQDGTEWDTRMVPLGRLRSGVSIGQASAVVDALSKSIPPEEGTTVRAARVEPVAALPRMVRAYLTSFLRMLLAMATLVLFIAAANIAGIMLARGVARRRDMAVRLALGSGRARMIRHLLAESLLLFAAGGGLGLGLAWLGMVWLSNLPLPPQAPDMIFSFAPDRRVLGFALAITGVTGMAFGLLPALRSSRPDLVAALKVGAGGSAGGNGVMRSIFVGGQVALAVTLMLAAALFARSLRAGLSVDLGFDPVGVVTARVPARGDLARTREFQEALQERVQALPGVEAVSWAQDVPLSGLRSFGVVRRPDAPDGTDVNAQYNIVSLSFFETLRIPLVAGRGFTRADAQGARRVVVINRTLADRLWPGESPLGRRLSGLVGEAVVVGVTGPGKYTFVTEPPAPFVYMPSLQASQRTLAILVLAPGAEAATLRALRGLLHDVDPNVALEMPMLLQDLVGTSVLPQRLASELVGAFGVAGLILSALGIYGVLAYRVEQRTREIGVRRALGATSRRVVGEVLWCGGLLGAVGCLIGVALGAGLALVVRSFLFGIQPLDPLTFMAVPVLLLAVALVASLLPAARAAAIEPAVALRSE